jgi:glutamyl-Q tRNA(Asp) synthetase
VEATNEAPGRPKRSSAPSGGSEVREATSVGATNEAPGRPKRSSAPSGGSEVREATSVGATNEAPGRPKRSSAPLGGSEVREATSVGATNEAPGRPKRSSAPSGGSEVREATSVGAISYIGRFAPSPTGPLHAGSLVAALASWLDARAHSGRWLVRIEDVDTPRCVAGADQTILAQLAACGLLADEPPVYQSQRGALYQHALDQLIAQRLAYPCGCTRQDIAHAMQASGQPPQRHGELIYPGTCRGGLNGKPARAWRLRTDKYRSNSALAQSGRAQAAINLIADEIVWQDRRLGWQAQNVSQQVGDFVLKRADGLWAYQLAVVVDDGAQGVTDIVRGEDLADNTARQMLLQRALGLPTPRYLHTPLVLGANGEKLSKQNGAQALDTSDPLALLAQAGQMLALPGQINARTPAEWLRQAVPRWVSRYVT